MNKKLKIFIFIISAVIFIVLLFFIPEMNNKEKSRPEENSQKRIEEEYKIGFITDVHGRKSTKKDGQVNKDSDKVLTYFMGYMNNNFNPDFVIDGGDLIEGTDREGQKSIDDFKGLVGYFRILKAPSYHVNGNHEMRGLSKNEWLKLTSYEKSFYYFDYRNLRTIILDGNENEKAFPEIKNYDKNYYYLSEEQFKWLEKILSESENFKKIVFIHYPPFETPGTKKINPDQSLRLREIFSKNKILAVFSGHTERPDFKEINDVRYFVIPGIWKSKLKHVLWLESFVEIIVKKDITVKLYYKKDREEEYRTLIIPSKEYETMEK
jgi:predicted MPP superfamily phosphohydrolase